MKWEDYFNALKVFLETALGKEVEIESFFGKRVFRVSDPDEANEILFFVYNIATKECSVLSGSNFVVLPVPVNDFKLFSGLPLYEKRPERFLEDFLCILKIEEGRGIEEWLE